LGVTVKEATIDAPAERIFAFVADAHNAPHYIGAIHKIVSGSEGPVSAGQSWQAEAAFLGQSHLITLRLLEVTPHKAVRFALEGEPQALLSAELSPGANASQTLVSLTLEVPSVPTFLLGGIMGGMLTSDLQRLKALMEG